MPSCFVDFTSIDDSNRRDRGRADAPHFHALRDKRAGHENCDFFSFLVVRLGSIDWRIGEDGSRKRRGDDESGKA